MDNKSYFNIETVEGTAINTCAKSIEHILKTDSNNHFIKCEFTLNVGELRKYFQKEKDAHFYYMVVKIPVNLINEVA